MKYLIGHLTKKTLEELDTSGACQKAIDRLYIEEGTREDVEEVAGLYEEADKQTDADELRRSCYGEGGDPGPDAPPDKRISLRVSRDQYQTISSAASKRGLSVATYVRMVALESSQ